MKNIIVCFYCICILLSISITSCVKPSQRDNLLVINDFPITINLEGFSINKIRNDFFPLQMGMVDSLIVFCDNENSPYFHVYKAPSFDFVGSFGKQGRGPGELENPSFWSQFEIDNSYKMWITQMDVMKFTLIDINKSIITGECKPDKEVKIPLKSGKIVNIININDSLCVGSGGDAEGEFIIYNSVKQEIVWKDFHEDKIFGQLATHPEISNEIRRGIVKIKPDKSKFVKSLVYFPVIDVYTESGDLEFSLMLKQYEKPEIINGQFSLKSRVYYENIYLTDRYIYALNRNCSIQDYDKGNDVEIHVFSWEGEPVYLFRLNEGIGPAAPFVIDEINRCIYTVNPKDESNFYSLFNIGDEVLFD